MSELGVERAKFTLNQQVEARSCLDVFNSEVGEEGLLQDFQIISVEGMERYIDETLPRHQADVQQMEYRIQNFGYGRENSLGYAQRIARFQNEPFVEVVNDFSAPRVGAEKFAIHGVTDIDVKLHRRWADVLEEYKDVLKDGDKELITKKALGVAAVLYPGLQDSSEDPAWMPGEVLQSIRGVGTYLSKVAGHR